MSRLRGEIAASVSPQYAALMAKRLGRRTHVCPKCDRVLAIAEVIERYCAHCGDVQPEEVRL
jgi:hypothetical protein